MTPTDRDESGKTGEVTAGKAEGERDVRQQSDSNRPAPAKAANAAIPEFAERREFAEPNPDILEGQLGPDELPDPGEVKMTQEARLHQA